LKLTIKSTSRLRTYTFWVKISTIVEETLASKYPGYNS
jgi:hypothetical protein